MSVHLCNLYDQKLWSIRGKSDKNLQEMDDHATYKQKLVSFLSAEFKEKQIFKATQYQDCLPHKNSFLKTTVLKIFLNLIYTYK